MSKRSILVCKILATIFITLFWAAFGIVIWANLPLEDWPSLRALSYVFLLGTGLVTGWLITFGFIYYAEDL